VVHRPRHHAGLLRRIVLYPTSYSVVEQTQTRAAVRLQGTHASPAYAWDILVEARDDSPLIRFRVTCQLGSGLTLSPIEQPQPIRKVAEGIAEDFLGYFGPTPR